MKALALIFLGFMAGLFAPDVINPHFYKSAVHWANTPLVGSFDPVACGLVALVLVGIHFARAKYK